MYETHSEATSDIARDLLRTSFDPRILIVDGNDCRVAVRQKQLQIIDGINACKRTRIVSRSDNLKRIIILCETGFVTLDAMVWCHDEGICISQYERDGKLIMHSCPHDDSPSIRVKQSIISSIAQDPTRLDTVKSFLYAKLEGQASVADDLFNRGDISDSIMENSRYLSKAITMQEILGFEGKSAQLYWRMWSGNVSIDWTSTKGIPSHWAEPFTVRSSGTRYDTPVNKFNRSLNDPTAGSRNAIHPVNAILNYAYKIAETECLFACLMHGLDPSVGFQHSISPNRHAMALDMLETVRPSTDRIVLDIINSQRFKREWCHEFSRGIIRLYPPLTHMIAERVTIGIAQSIEPHAYELASTLKSLRIPGLSV